MNARAIFQTHSERHPLPAIITPWVDALCVGGASLLVLVPLLLLRPGDDLVPFGTAWQATLALLINWPHFMASYRMVYRSRETILRHKWASIYVPGLLLAYCAAAVRVSHQHPIWVVLLNIVSGGYLAWHYTGQAWGMMAAFAHLEGAYFTKLERHLIRGGLRVLLVWHVTWFLYYLHQREFPGDGMDAVRRHVAAIYDFMNGVTGAGLALGAAGLALFSRRTGKLPPWRALVAWGAIYVWYAALARDARAIFWVQIAHALQYLIFPVRVEMNLAMRRPAGRPVTPLKHMTCYGIILLAVSFAVTEAVPFAAMAAVATFVGFDEGTVVPEVVLAFVNIHHYFTDGCIWKLRNADVREDLFGHVGKGKACASPA